MEKEKKEEELWKGTKRKELDGGKQLKELIANMALGKRRNSNRGFRLIKDNLHTKNWFSPEQKFSSSKHFFSQKILSFRRDSVQSESQGKRIREEFDMEECAGKVEMKESIECDKFPIEEKRDEFLGAAPIKRVNIPSQFDDTLKHSPQKEESKKTYSQRSSSNQNISYSSGDSFSSINETESDCLTLSNKMRQKQSEEKKKILISMEYLNKQTVLMQSKQNVLRVDSANRSPNLLLENSNFEKIISIEDDESMEIEDNEIEEEQDCRMMPKIRKIKTLKMVQSSNPSSAQPSARLCSQTKEEPFDIPYGTLNIHLFPAQSNLNSIQQESNLLSKNSLNPQKFDSSKLNIRILDIDKIPQGRSINELSNKDYLRTIQKNKITMEEEENLLAELRSIARGAYNLANSDPNCKYI